MKRLLLALLAVSCLGIGWGVAQNITKAIQLSQDATGAFGIDTVNSVYFPNHVNTNISTTPSISSVGTAATIVGTDTAGVVTGGGANTQTTTLTFSTAYGARPACTVTSQNSATSPLGYLVTAAILAISPMGAAVANYVCVGVRQ